MVVRRLTYVEEGQIIAALRWVSGDQCQAPEQTSGARAPSVLHHTIRCAAALKGSRSGTLRQLRSLIRLRLFRLLLSLLTTRGPGHLRVRLVERMAARWLLPNNVTSIRRVIIPAELTYQTLRQSLIPACTGWRVVYATTVVQQDPCAKVTTPACDPARRPEMEAAV